MLLNPKPLTNFMHAYGVADPEPVAEARALLDQARQINPNPVSLVDVANELLDENPANLTRAIDKAATRLAAESVRPNFVDGLRRQAEQRLCRALSANAAEIVDGILASPRLAESAEKVIAHAATLSPDTLPTFDSRTPPETVFAIASINAGWDELARVAKMPGDFLAASEIAGPAFLLLDVVEYESKEQTQAVATALSGLRPGAVSLVAHGMTVSEELNKDRRIPAVSLAHIPGVTLRLATSRDEYRARVAAFNAAISPDHWEDYKPQTFQESWDYMNNETVTEAVADGRIGISNDPSLLLR